MRIGIDIDGVVSDSYPFWLQELNCHYGKNIPCLDDYNMHISFEVTTEDMNNFFETNIERLLMMPKPIPGAKLGIETLLQEGHEIIYVTARTQEQKGLTERWFANNKIYYKNILFSGFGSKVGFVKEWGIEAFIEDYHVNAKLIAECGVPVFLLDASYNQEDTPGGIIRCHSWEEIVKGIHNLKC
ncbi:hypothetical protein DP73_05805 [Desulfosporosinus sp. HMP52]|uniref:5' nucleotidase, NT5C type n=1 Tax=Desulfosporosinus sp. HMP52 TaxID=1487923 RepID=UPI00051F8B93|nr:hypothetical protein [Desulfosporosinus sp. HMP52]KGK90964.1 hypothetical protein DP73_05805 [Desulfosporosinus sp. HMP52]